uniref:Uncharacterized protein n=1 Tax=viral metagenome TaxID=1070528 RepID=A0A6C0C4K4_9ZZZZ
MPVTKASNVNFSKISFSDPRKLGQNGVQIVFVNYDGNQNPLYIQTPKVGITWDSKYFPDTNGGDGGKYGVQFSMPITGGDKVMTSFHDKMVEFDNHMIDIGYENRAIWFKNGKKLSRETVETLYSPMVKLSTDSETGEPNGKYPPSFKFKIKRKDGVHECSVYDSNKSVYNIDNKDDDNFVNLEDILVKGASMNVILKCSMVWLINNKFGVTWYGEQIMVTEKVSSSLGSGCAFIDDDDDEQSDTVDNSVAPAEEVVDSDDESDEVNNASNDSDDDSDEGDDEPAPEPQPATKKKVRRVNKKA